MSSGSGAPAENSPGNSPPVSTFMGPVAELVAQRILSPPARPGVLAQLDHYEILRVLGGGGMGIVLLARDLNTGREAAIKLVRSELLANQSVVHRFLKEAGHLKRLRHTNIVPVLEISELPGRPYFTMPFFSSGSLANRIKPGQPLDNETVLELAAQVADGLGFAHRSGIIHRDLKPANILLGSDGQVCLGDFGLARTVFNDTIVDAEERHFEGTAPYMSPAVAAGNAEDTRCDIYSFGALLYEMLTGLPPYQGRGTREILDQIIAGPPRPILSLNPSADPRLVTVAETAMARELRDRYAEMRDASSDLGRIKAGQQPAAQRRAQRARRVPLLIEVAACVVGLGILAFMFWRERNAPTRVFPPAAATSPATNAPVLHPPPPPSSPPVLPSWTTTILAGQPGIGGSLDGPVKQAQFRLPNSVAVDHAGNVYVADTANNVIRKINGVTGIVTTLAGAAGTHGSADGTGGSARFWAPFGIAVDGVGNVYVADTGNNIIRKITAGGVVTTLAGLAGHPGSDDGLRAYARFRNPWGLADDSAGNVIVADMSNNAIRKISPSGQVSTLAGLAGTNGTADGFAANARFYDPFAVAVDGADNIYVSDSVNNTIRKISPSGSVITLAGLPGSPGDRDGDAVAARFWNPQGLAVDRAGNIYVADSGNNLIRKMTPTGTVSVFPGSAGTGSAANIPWNSPNGVAVDDAGNVYVADTNNHCVRKISGGR
jgi:serine/threonine protein kinase/sugar lactone lactonase YvrE